MKKYQNMEKNQKVEKIQTKKANIYQTVNFCYFNGILNSSAPLIFHIQSQNLRPNLNWKNIYTNIFSLSKNKKLIEDTDTGLKKTYKFSVHSSHYITKFVFIEKDRFSLSPKTFLLRKQLYRIRKIGLQKI